MRKRDLLNRIEELERRLADVEARPMPALAPIHVPIYPQPTVAPYWNPGWVVTSGAGTSGFVHGVTATNATTLNSTHTGSPC